MISAREAEKISSKKRDSKKDKNTNKTISDIENEITLAAGRGDKCITHNIYVQTVDDVRIEKVLLENGYILCKDKWVGSDHVESWQIRWKIG